MGGSTERPVVCVEVPAGQGVQVGADGEQHNTFIGTHVSDRSSVPLRAAAKDARAVFSAAGTDGFTGRGWLAGEVDRFIGENPCGYVFVEAEAGLGKTAFAAWLAKSRGYLSHFSRYSDGRSVRVALANLSAQLILRFGLDEAAPGGMLAEWAQTPGGFESLLAAASSARETPEPVVLVVDGLDEADSPGEGLPFGLPVLLPDGVFVVGTYRTGCSPGWPDAPAVTVPVRRHDPRNRRDIDEYLTRAAGEEVLAARLAEANMGQHEFADLLAERCGGVWVYLRYVLGEVRLGLRRPNEIGGLPTGLRDYYADQVRRWQHDPGWHDGLLALLAALGVAGEALPAASLARLADADPVAVRRWCDLTIRPLLTTTRALSAGVPLRYEIYHASFREFLNPTGWDLAAQPDDQQPYEIVALAEDLRHAAAAAHDRISDIYLNLFGGLDAGLPILAASPAAAGTDGGYPLRHLARHLCQAGRVADLHALLAAEHTHSGNHSVNTWFAAHDHVGTIIGYLADIARARSDSAAATDRDLSQGNRTPALGMELRYALMTASIASLTSGIPADLLKLLVQARVWSPGRALDHAQRLTDPRERSEVLLVICDHVSADERSDVLVQALTAATAITSDAYRAQTLARLAPHLPSDLLTQALTTATAITSDRYRAEALTGLAPHLPGNQRPAILAQALTAAATITRDDDRAGALAELAPHLPPDLLAQGLTVATAITSDYPYARALTKLAPHLPGNQRVAVLAQALTAATAIASDDDRAEALTGLAPHLPDDQRVAVLAQALTAATAITTSDGSRAQTLAGLAPHLPSDLLTQALTTATAITSDHYRAEALTGLAPHLPPDLLAQALTVATAITSDASRAQALTGLTPHLPGNKRPAVLAQALTAATAITSDYYRARALTRLAPHLPGNQRPAVLAQALTAATTITSDYPYARALTRLAPHLPDNKRPAILAQALTTATAITNDDDRARALTGLAPHLPPNLLARALTTATAITSDHYRARALTGLAPHLPPNLLARALTTATAITSDYYRARALTGLAPHVPGNQRPAILAQALTAATTTAITSDYCGAQALTGLAPHLPPDLLARALTVATAITSDSCRAEALTGLAPHLPPDLLTQALTTATAITSDHYRAEALTGLAPHLPGNQRPAVLAQALTTATAITSDHYRAQALTGLAPHLPPDLLVQALAVTPKASLETLLAVLDRGRNGLTPSRRATYIGLLRGSLDGTGRSTCFDIMGAVAADLAEVGGVAAIQQGTRAVIDTYRWWP